MLQKTMFNPCDMPALLNLVVFFPASSPESIGLHHTTPPEHDNRLSDTGNVNTINDIARFFDFISFRPPA